MSQIPTPPEKSLVREDHSNYLLLDLADGYRGFGRLCASKKPRCAVVYLHGIQSHGGWFLRSIQYLQNQNMTVLAPDRRGSGMNGVDRGHCKNPGQLMEDLDCCVDWLRDHTGMNKVALVAVSWSGKWALSYAHQYPDKLSHLALVAPGLCARVDISLREKIKVGINGLAHPARQHEIPLEDPHLFTANPPMLDFIQADPLKLTHTTASFLVASSRLDLHVRKIIPDIQVPVTLFLAEHDRIIDNRRTLGLLGPVLTRSESGQGRVYTYPDTHHTLDFEPEPSPFFMDLAQVLGKA